MKKQLRVFVLLLALLPFISYAQDGRGGSRQGGGGDRRHDGGSAGSSGYSDNESSTLSVFSENGEQFFLVLNGINQNNAPTNKIRGRGPAAVW